MIIGQGIDQYRLLDHPKTDLKVDHWLMFFSASIAGPS